MPNTSNRTIVVSALHARSNFGKLLRRVEHENRSLVIEKRGVPKAVLLSIRDYVRLAAPEPEVLRVIGEEFRREGTDKLSSRQINQVIRAVLGLPELKDLQRPPAATSSAHQQSVAGAKPSRVLQVKDPDGVAGVYRHYGPTAGFDLKAVVAPPFRSPFALFRRLRTLVVFIF